MHIRWSASAWEDYLFCQRQDRRVLGRINELVRDIARNGHEGIGQPEALRHELSGYWSRRITQEHRLVYAITENEIRIAGCRYHCTR